VITTNGTYHVMVHNSTNIDTTNNHLSFQTNEHKNNTTFGVGNSGPCLGQAKHVAGLNPLMGSTSTPSLINDKIGKMNDSIIMDSTIAESTNARSYTTTSSEGRICWLKNITL